MRSIQLPLLPIVLFVALAGCNEAYDGSESRPNAAPPPEAGAELSPRLVTKGELLIDDDFETPHELESHLWVTRHGSRAFMEDGLLAILPATEEYQAEATARGDTYTGDTPRLLVKSGPAWIAEFYLRTEGGSAALYFGKHNVRVKNSGEDLILKRGKETFDTAPGFRIEPGEWYHVMLELEGESAVAQFEDGPVLQATDPAIAEENTNFRIFGGTDVTLFFDDFKVWAAQ